MTTSNEDTPVESRKKPVGLMLVLLGTVIVVFITWYSTWFGRPLSDDDLASRLHLESKPRAIQHALERLRVRIDEGKDIAKFRPAVLALKDHELSQVRHNVAWTMGYQPAPEFKEALRGFLQDEVETVRRQAAFALAKYRDGAGRPILVACLAPVEVRAPTAGVLDHDLAIDDPVSVSRAIAVIDTGATKTEIQPLFDGRILELPVKSGEEIAKDALVCKVSPDPIAVQNAILALRMVGTREDAPHLTPIMEGRYGNLPDRVRLQARQAHTELSQR